MSTPALTLPLEDPQWTLETLQVVNWGGFDGHHSIDLSGPATLLTGGSGTGKSTLLDAVIAVMMDSNTPYNGASNDAGTGRVRGATQRNTLSYVRGKVADTRADGQDAVRTLRGNDGPTWSAISLTWRSTAHTRHTALRVFHAAADAHTDGDLDRRLATIDSAFDLTALERHAAARFSTKALRAEFPQMVFHTTYAGFAGTFQTRLSLGLPGERRALTLLAKIQRGGTMHSVDTLFKTLVLDPPDTYRAAADALTHFDDLAESHRTMRDAEEKLDTLAAIETVHADRVAAEAEIDLIDAYRTGVQDSPFHTWATATRAGLIDAAVSANRAENVEATTANELAAAAHTQTETDLQEAQRARDTAGGNRLDEIRTHLTEFSQSRQETAARRATLDGHLAVLAATVTDRAEFERLLAAGRTFLATVPEKKAAMQAEDDELAGPLHQTFKEQRLVREEATYLRGRRDLIPADLDRFRSDAAQASGLAAEDLPFVAELIDVHPDHSEWRTAIELALGGFAVTMLVPADRIGAVRSAVNALRWSRRVKFEAATTGLPHTPAADPARLPGRLTHAESPFTGWLSARLDDRFNYTCVEHPAELDNVTAGLTVTGQTRAGTQGAHGGNDRHRPIIGFSPQARLDQLAARDAELDTELEALQAARNNLRVQISGLDERAVAHNAVAATAWEAVDVARIDARIEDLEAEQAKLLDGSDALRVAQERVLELREAEQLAREAKLSATQRVKDLDTAWLAFVEKQDQVNEALWRLEDLPGAFLSEGHRTRLDDGFGTLVGQTTLDTFDRDRSNYIRHLGIEATAARTRRDQCDSTLRQIFAAYLRSWPSTNLTSDPQAGYPDFRDLLADLRGRGLAGVRAEFTRRVADWSGEDLLILHSAFDTALDDIRARLLPVNTILAELPFGTTGDRLKIDLTATVSRDVAAFRRELRQLASDTTTLATPEQVDDRFARISGLMERLRERSGSARDTLLDVRRQVHIEAHRLDHAGQMVCRHDTLGEQSGGESQELIAFIVGAALRYQLGDPAADRPRYAPVILDEGFIKADGRFSGRGVAAWRGLGFQLIIATPEDKLTAIEPHVAKILVTTKDPQTHRSRVLQVDGLETVA